jgi:two-component system CheB/CheR fusion protein
MAIFARRGEFANCKHHSKPGLTMATGKRTVVWVVDDVESVRKSIAAVLETANMAVCDYASAGEFLAAFKPGAVGCLIVDHHMQGMTGLELLQHLKDTSGVPPTFVITGQGNAGLNERLLAAGAIKVLNKPVDGDEIITLIEHVMLNGA